MTKRLVISIAVCCTLFLLALPVFAQEDAAPQIDDEMMQKWMAASAPGENHEWLKKFEGEWKSVNTSYWGGPGSEPVVSEGSVQSEMILGGRFLSFSGTQPIMNMKMEGMGFIGYDNMENHYTLMWIDNLGTAMYLAAGTREGDMLTLTGTMDEPMTGEMNKPIRYEYTWQDADTYVFKLFDLVGTENEFVAMEETTTRLK